MTCRYDRTTGKHLTREHRTDCSDRTCLGCQPCTHDDDGNPVRHCRTRRRCTSHLGWEEYTCPTCVGKIRANLTRLQTVLALMPAEATERGVNSEPANLAGPHADYVTSAWRLVNAARNGETVEELDLLDPYTCLTMYERTIREDLGHDQETLVSPDVHAAASYLDWVLTDLARDEQQTPILTDLLGATARLRAHAEIALRDSRTPERGVPCPACVTVQQKTYHDLAARGVPEDEWPKLRAPRLTRVYAHWCTDPDCEREHYLDASGDVWRCPDDRTHEWTHDAYEAWLVERRRSA